MVKKKEDVGQKIDEKILQELSKEKLDPMFLLLTFMAFGFGSTPYPYIPPITIHVHTDKDKQINA